MSRVTLALVACLACGRAPKIEPEPEPEEPQFELNCDLKAGMEPHVVEEKCGAPFSKVYSPDLEDAVIWRYCGRKGDGSYLACHQFYAVVFYSGTVFRWGRIYEVVQ